MAFDKQRFVGDQLGSTYRWDIYLNNNYHFVGYSKDKNTAEKADKAMLLMDCIARIVNKGYLAKSYHWPIYQRDPSGKGDHELILELYPDRYTCHKGKHLDLVLTGFLDRLYQAIQAGQPFNASDLKPKRLPSNQQELLDFKFDKGRFPTLEDLNFYCREFLLKKYVQNRVIAWWRAHSPQYAPAEQPPTPSHPEPEVVQTASNTINALTGLYAKHQTKRR